MSDRIVIIGSGIAGDEAAFAARRTDPDSEVFVVTQDTYPLYSACVLADYIADEIPRDRVLLKKKKDYSDAGIKIQLSAEVSELDTERSVIQLNDKDMYYDKLILATGSRTFIPKIPGAGMKGVFTLKSLKDADSIKNAGGKSAVVVGGGPVGIEASVALHKKGYSVVLIELLDHLLPGLFDPPLSESIQDALMEKGIDIQTSERVVEIMGEEHVSKIKTDKKIINCDVVVLVAGMTPEVTIAQNSGLKLGKTGGISVNEFMQTGKRNIWACGDCVESTDRVTGHKGTYMLWNNARIQGRTAGINASGGNARYPGSLNITTVNINSIVAVSTGEQAMKYPENEVKVIHRKGHKGELWLVFKDKYLIGAQTIGHLDLIGGMLKIMLNKSKINDIVPAKQNQLLNYWSIRGLRRELKD